MTIPTLPTDNLYKFMAVSGLLASLVGWLAPEVLHFQYVEALTHDTEQQIKKTMESEFESNPALADKLREIAMQVFKKSIREGTLSENSSVLVSIQKDKYDAARILGNRVLSVGLSFSLVGFVLWWFKVQRLQDSILKAELRKVLAEERTLAKPG